MTPFDEVVFNERTCNIAASRRLVSLCNRVESENRTQEPNIKIVNQQNFEKKKIIFFVVTQIRQNDYILNFWTKTFCINDDVVFVVVGLLLLTFDSPRN